MAIGTGVFESNPTGRGAMTDGVYATQATDLLSDAQPEIEIDIEPDPEDPIALTVVVEIEDPHGVNLLDTVLAPEEGAEHENVKGLVSALVTDFDDDKMSRDQWEKTYREGLKLLGLQIEQRTEPWDGACGVFHPLLTEAVVRFQSEAITETFPASGPVKTQIIGKVTPERTAAAERVKDDMNWRLTDEMPEYRVEHERLLWSLPIAGSAFKKVYFDESLGRQVSTFVPAEDVVVNYGAQDIASAERVTHVIRRSETWLKKMIAAGVYSEVDLDGSSPDADETQDEKDKLIGVDGANSQMYTLLEIQVNLCLEGEDDDVPLPYVVTLLKDTNELLSIRRNWAEDDPRHKPLVHFVHYQYIVGFGFYGFGLVHLVGGHAAAGTSLLRQLVDAGTLSNLPGGFKARGMRVQGADTPISPGEFRDVDVTSGTIRDNILPLPYKEPSGTLFQLLQSIVEDGRKSAAISDVSFSEANQNAPVGTTLALIERQLKTLSAVQARVHAAMRIEFKLIKALVASNGEREYPYDADPDRNAKDADYSIIEILPVSDPNATTMGVRIAQYQAVLELATRSPQLYDMAYLHREMLNVLGLKNAQKIVPLPNDQKPRDPVSENMAVLMGKPVRAFVAQDHQSHIVCHQAFMQDPKIGMLLGQNPNAQAMFGSMQAHIAEHAAYAYRDQVQKALGVPLPDPNEEMDTEMEYQLAGLLAQAAQAVQAQNQQEQAQIQAQQKAQDPVLQLQQAELQLRDREVKVKEGDLQLKAAKTQAEIASMNPQAAQAQAAVEMQTKALAAQADEQRKTAAMATEQQRKTVAAAEEQSRARAIMASDEARKAYTAAAEAQRARERHDNEMRMAQERSAAQSKKPEGEKK